MSLFADFVPVGQLFLKSKDSGKVIDSIYFVGQDNDIDDIPAGAVVLFSVQKPQLADMVDTFPIRIRKRFYDLYLPSELPIRIYDLGVFFTGNNKSKTLTNVINHLISKKITILLISAENHIHTLLYKGLEKALKSVSITEASTLLPFSESHHEEIEQPSWLKMIITKQGNKLFNFSNLGMQAFLNPQENQDLFRKLLFDSTRMGALQHDINIAEPTVRDADLFIWDMNIVKASDAPGVLKPNPNGLSGFDACRFSRFAGIAERNKIFCINNIGEHDDDAMVTSFLIAQMFWFYMEAFFSRMNESPKLNHKDFNTFVVESEKEGTFIFLQSRISDRWWVLLDRQNGKKMTISCLKKDYIDMTEGEIPERMMRFLNKIS